MKAKNYLRHLLKISTLVVLVGVGYMSLTASSCPPAPSCTSCTLTMCLTDVPAGEDVYSINIKVGHGTPDQVNTLMNGGSVSMASKNVYIRNPDPNNYGSLVTWNVPCDDWYFMVIFQVLVRDPSCPSGFHSYDVPSYVFWNNPLFDNGCDVTKCVSWNDLTDEGCL